VGATFHQGYCNSDTNFQCFALGCCLTAPFSGMRTLGFGARPTDAFFAAVGRVFGDSSQLPTTAEQFRCLNCAQRFDYRELGSSWKLGGTAEHLIDGGEECICRLSFEFWSPHVIERRCKQMSRATFIVPEAPSLSDGMQRMVEIHVSSVAIISR